MGIVESRIIESINTKKKILDSKEIVNLIKNAGECVQNTFANGGKVFLCGNGGSASDAVHIAAELVGRFQKDRQSLPAIALNSDMAAITSISNDYSFEQVYARIISGVMKSEDTLIGISTSGESQNVYQAIIQAKRNGGKTIALLGKGGGIIKNVADISIVVPDNCTARIQEAHIMIGHIICEIAEEKY